MHARLGVLWRHVEPYASSHGQEAVLVDQVRVLEQIHLAVVRAWGEDIRELTVVVVP